MATPVGLDWSSPEFLADPYPFLHRLRSADPIHRHESGFWLVTRYDDAVAMLRDPRFIRPPLPSSEQLGALIEQDRLSPREFLRTHGVLWKNPPDHTRLRRLLSKAFTPRVVQELRAPIEARVEELLSSVQDLGRMDVVADLAYPLPVMTIAELLGVPVADRSTVRRWSRDLVGAFDPARGPDATERGNQAIEAFADYFGELIVERRDRPQADLLSSLIAVQDAGEGLTDRELLANVIFLFVAGHETTVGLIGNGTLALLRNPDQLARLRDNRTPAEGAVEELLRYDSPEQTIFWTVAEDVIWKGRLLRPGEEILIMVGAVNRDPERFREPDTLDLARTDNRHLAFSHGIHFCLGAPLARAQGQIAIPALARRFPKLRLAGDPRWQPTMFIHELGSLPVTLH